MTGITTKARAEVENLVDELVQTLEQGVMHPDGSPGFGPRQIEGLRSDLRDYADAILAGAHQAARGRVAAKAGQAPVDHGAPAKSASGGSGGSGGSALAASVDAAVETIGEGVRGPAGSPGFGPEQAEQLRESLRGFGEAVVRAAGGGAWLEVDARIDDVVRTVRSGLFLVYGRGPFAAISGDQLEAYLQTFADAVMAVVERERTMEERDTA